MPEELLNELQAAAKKTGLSVADIMRQSMKLGLPSIVGKFQIVKVRTMTKEEAKEAYAPDPEWDALEAHMTKRAVHRVPSE